MRVLIMTTNDGTQLCIDDASQCEAAGKAWRARFEGRVVEFMAGDEHIINTAIRSFRWSDSDKPGADPSGVNPWGGQPGKRGGRMGRPKK